MALQLPEDLSVELVDFATQPHKSNGDIYPKNNHFPQHQWWQNAVENDSTLVRPC